MTTVAEPTAQSHHPVDPGTIVSSNAVSDLVETFINAPEKESFWDIVKTIYAFTLLGFGLLFPFVAVAWKMFFGEN